MSTSIRPALRETYHHGDLRAALVDAALEALVTGGEAKVSLREVARRVGVSPAAPYRHFKSRADLLAAVATAGFVRFRNALEDAKAFLPEREHLAAMGSAYVAFARHNRALFQLMFSPALDKDGDAALKAACDASFAQLVEAAFRERGDDPYDTAVATWALVHGLAQLLNDRQILNLDPGRIDALVAGITRRFVEGLRAARR